MAGVLAGAVGAAGASGVADGPTEAAAGDFQPMLTAAAGGGPERIAGPPAEGGAEEGQGGEGAAPVTGVVAPAGRC